ncbi:hypothetical protein OH76DRAFT_481347 [Lentinus brumalis]|uniref:DUF7904 domain-containing protein n=1 Tax=Lentinus brumalis TaxID=2498619 RepID=A0A371DC16_9APHY|nr:hypothetical protein OH76DRAFT_481347 [Polyporus brumalis]
MDVPRPSSAARRSTTSIPAKPDASLAEWTSKIKAMQKQVDEDEDAETRRLEAEIAASRQARMRRSTNLGSRTNSIDLSQSGIAAAIKADDRSVVSDEPLTAMNKQRNQDDALRKLMGEDAVAGAPSRSPAHTTAPAPGPAAAPSKRPSSPISLAAFMGGRATGPRLTRHAPQQDAHDPTQFEQRTNVSAPHPVFGRGGVAMPGMTGHGSASVVSRAIREEETRSSPSSSVASQRDRRISTPTTAPSVRAAVEKAQGRDREIQPSPTDSSQAAVRQRTMSTPTGVAPLKPVAPAETFSTKPKVDPVTRPLAHSPSPTIIRPITPRTTSSGSKSPAPRPSSAAFHTPPPPSVSPKPLPGLARPIQPNPRPSFGSPQMPPSHNASPAFLRPPPAKEPTPSLSRLQGRGFVKNMVEKTVTVTSPEGSPTPDKTHTPGRRQSSVLDRWHHTGDGVSTPPPMISPKPMPLRKSFTVDPAQTSPTASSYSVPLKRDSTGPVLRSKTSLPLLPTMKTGDSVGGFSSVSESAYNGPKLGSAKTVVTYIQPTKTSDEPSPPLQTHRTGDVDELGMRVRTRTTSGGLVQERGAAGLPEGTSGKPLSHPTKERAKKPRKGKSAPASSSASKLTAIREGSPVRNDTMAMPPSGLRADPERSAPSLTPPQTFIPVRTTSPTSQYPSPPSTNGRSVSSTGRSAIPPKPTLDTLEIQAPTATVTSAKTSPTSSLAAPPAARSPSVSPPGSKAQKPPSSPARHTRIPSTGNRATVMDVAQVFTEALQRPPSSPVVDSPSKVKSPAPPSSLGTSHADNAPEEEEEYTPPSVKNLVSNWGPRTGGSNGDAVGASGTSRPSTISAPPLEKRKSSYEKYSAFIMPPVAEERTPVPSPAGTLKQDAAPDPALLEEEEEEEVEVTKAEKTTDIAVRLQEEVSIPEKEVPAPVASQPPQPKAAAKDALVRLVHSDEPLPHVNVDALYRAPRTTYKPDPDIATISVDVMTIVGSTATAVSANTHVFYDSEVLAVIHRAKVKSSGLVATKVWAWHGKRAQTGEKESQKVQELARRYGTAPIVVEQGREPPEFVSVLGGTLATRQGTRAHWSAENTAMHLVRSLQGFILIDELDLSIKNLCSAYSYCISILDTFYVWHGRGSTAAEQRAALSYAQSLAPSTDSVVEFTEEESQADEMFWMILGEGDYAKADYWKWRPTAPIVDPRAWIVDATQEEVFRPVAAFPGHPEFSQAVFLVDCVWELFVIIGSEARGRRLDIKLAVSVAHALAAKASPTLPFTPTVHALIFPTQIPIDLLLTFRELDESALNSGDIPDHMNLIPASDADTDLKSTTWTSAALQDHTMLPLGVNPSHL